jgi:hypothetical protein
MSYQDPEHYLEYPYLALRDSGVMLWPDIGDLVDEWLKVLREEGLPDQIQLRASGPSRHSSSGISFKSVTVEDPMNDPPYQNTYAARLNNGEVVWVRIGEGSPQGYEVRVLEKRRRTDKAILAALTVLESYPIEVERLRRALPLVKDFSVQTLSSMHGAWEWLRLRGLEIEKGSTLANEDWRAAVKENLRFFEDLQLRSLWYLVTVLRYYRPGFDTYPREEQDALIIRACSYVNDLLEALRKFNSFLEYGQPDKDLRAGIEDPQQDVDAAVLKDVEGLSYRLIGERLGIPASSSDQIKGGNTTVAKMVKRGRDVLERALADKGGWQKQAELLRTKADKR